MYKLISDIHKEYNGQWVYLKNLKHNDQGNVIGGEIAANSECREKVMMALRPEDGVYIFYAGKTPEGISVIL